MSDDQELIDAIPGGQGFIDFPTAWALQRSGLEHTDPRCSAVSSGGCILCDCGAVEEKWVSLREAANE